MPAVKTTKVNFFFEEKTLSVSGKTQVKHGEDFHPQTVGIQYKVLAAT